MYQSSTIFALSSGASPSGVAVVRVSGPEAKAALGRLCGFVPDDRMVRLADIRDIAGQLLDRGLVIAFTAPASFTGEDCAEFHIHGGRASIAALLGALASMPELRQAEAGEFTRRAFVNGKLDLTGVEALGDLISAETEMQRRFALANAGGRQAALYATWRDRILHARAMIEAELDFSDEGDVPGSVSGEVWRDIAGLISEMGGHLKNAKSGEIARDGYKVVIVGAPNAGKSSLLNRLADRDAAIVSDEPGTTRDLVEVVLDLGGVRTVVTDTAGLRDEPGRVEAMGIERARKRAAESDLIVVLEDLTAPAPIALPQGPDMVRVGSKIDLAGTVPAGTPYDLCISSQTGAGIDALIRVIQDRAWQGAGDALMSAVPSRLRHVELIGAARSHLAGSLSSEADVELRAEELRLAGDCLGRITGSIETEDVLGVIFGQFCIGK